MREREHPIIMIENGDFFPHIQSLLSQKEQHTITFTLRGFSMRPFLEHERDKIILRSPLPPKVGQVVLAEIKPKTYVLHRIIRIQGEEITLRGDGNALRTKEYCRKEQIIGTAEAFLRRNTLFSVNGKAWRFYSLVWEILKPLRRYLLALHRRIIKYYDI